MTDPHRPEQTGPVLFARGADGSNYRLSAILVLEQENEPPLLRPMDGAAVEPAALASEPDGTVWRYDFDLPADRGAFYRLGAVVYEVAADLTGDLRLAYVSCNGQEHDDGVRALEERNRMWQRLADEHERAPFGLILHGGDQLYADEVVQAHPTLAAWAHAGLDQKSAFSFSDDMKAAAERYLFRRYVALYAQPEIACLLARVPSVMMWDDHDIIDGWGSHPAPLLDSAVGRGLFEAARRLFLLFQMGATDATPAFAFGNGIGKSLSFKLALPGVDVIVPDLRTERRPDRVMGPDGWTAVTRALQESNSSKRRFLLSSVPLLGPRLSWVERLIGVVPKLRRFEDDLRDQWQSRAHREEWQRLLMLLERTVADGHGAVTVLSGEIHLATRGVMALKNGDALQQLVASGIAHPAPPEIYARALGCLAAFGEDPLPGKPIRLKPLPGQKRIYVAERNYLVLERQGEGWTASWELERTGRTPPLAI